MPQYIGTCPTGGRLPLCRLKRNTAVNCGFLKSHTRVKDFSPRLTTEVSWSQGVERKCNALAVP